MTYTIIALDTDSQIAARLQSRTYAQQLIRDLLESGWKSSALKLVVDEPVQITYTGYDLLKWLEQ